MGVSTAVCGPPWSKWSAIHHASLAVISYVGFEVLTAEIMNNSLFWDIPPCSRLEVNRRFGRTYCIHLLRQRITQARNSVSHLLRAGFLLCLFFDPEDGSEVILRNVCWLSTDYTEHFRRYFVRDFVSLLKHSKDGALYLHCRVSGFVHCPVFRTEHSVSEAELCSPQVKRGGTYSVGSVRRS
jgi:hypothetical protein